ncbi:MAG: protein jag [bacterium]|nr:protein jag [bacterium]
MKVAEEYARTVEEARTAAIRRLGAEEGDPNLEIEVIDEGSKGVFGWGNKFARVRAVLKNDAEDVAEEVLNRILSCFDLTGSIEKEQDGDVLRFNIIGGDMGLLIGKRGQTLDALQFLLSLIYNKKRKDKAKIILDIEGYRQRRERSLKELAAKSADRAKYDRKNVVLEPMAPNERRIIHLALQNNPDVVTFSQGEEPMRHVVISPKTQE